MSKIKGKDSKPEILVRKFLHAKGFRFKLHDKTLPGKPDIVLPKYKVVIQINGCFWHGHKGCKYFRLPSTRSDWWLKKINQTKMRDQINSEKLIDLGWKNLIVWECEIKKDRIITLNKLISRINE